MDVSSVICPMLYELPDACPDHHVALTLGLLTGYKIYAGLVFSPTVLSGIE